MISTKEIYMRICNSGIGKELTKDELKKLQDHLIRMYRDIEDVCNKHDIKICLAYGNVIGAMRHNGWIPWDDDLDIHMSRMDYEKFIKICHKELPPKYIVSSYRAVDGAISRFTKVIDSETVHIPIAGENGKYSGVFIDIFPIDNVPTGNLSNKLRRLFSFFMMYSATSVQQVEGKSQKYKEMMFTTKEGKANWRFRQLWGRIFSFASSRTWHRWIELFAQNKRDTGYCHVMADLNLCYRAIPKDYFFPFREIELPDIGKIHIPNKYDEYLTLSYGDWRKVPDDADKWHHYVSELYIPEEAE